MDAYMGATAFRQVRQDRLRQQTGFPIAGLASCLNPLGPVPKLGSCSEVLVGVASQVPLIAIWLKAQDTIEVQDLMCDCIPT